MLRQRRDIVRDDDAPLVGCPLQNRGVIRTRQAHVLNADDIELRVSAKEPSDDVPVEVLVSCKPQRRRSSSASGSNSCFFQREFRSTETALFEPP